MAAVMSENDLVKFKQVQFRQIPEVTIHCCVCFSQGRMIPATTVSNGYACCGDHLELVSSDKFDLGEFYGMNRRRGGAPL